MHRTCCQYHWQRHTLFTAISIGQHHMLTAAANRLFGMAADPVKGSFHAIRTFICPESTVNLNRLVAQMILDSVPFCIGYYRAIQYKMFTLLGAFIQNIAQIPEPCTQGHDMAFA